MKKIRNFFKELFTAILDNSFIGDIIGFISIIFVSIFSWSDKHNNKK